MHLWTFSTMERIVQSLSFLPSSVFSFWGNPCINLTGLWSEADAGSRLKGHLAIRSDWVHMTTSTFCMPKNSQFLQSQTGRQIWLRCTALLEIERRRILWAAKDLEASSLLINLWQEVCLSALCAMLLIYMLIWIQLIAGISSMASFQSLSISLQKQFRNMFGNAKPLGMYFFGDRWFILLKKSLSVPQS